MRKHSGRRAAGGPGESAGGHGLCHPPTRLELVCQLQSVIEKEAKEGGRAGERRWGPGEGHSTSMKKLEAQSTGKQPKTNSSEHVEKTHHIVDDTDPQKSTRRRQNYWALKTTTPKRNSDFWKEIH